MFLQFFIKYNQCVKIRNQVWFDVHNEFANFHPSHKNIRIWQLVVYIIAKTVCFYFVQHSIFFHQKILGTLLEDYQTCVYSSLQQLRNKVKMKKEKKNGAFTLWTLISNHSDPYHCCFYCSATYGIGVTTRFIIVHRKPLRPPPPSCGIDYLSVFQSHFLTFFSSKTWVGTLKTLSPRDLIAP